MTAHQPAAVAQILQKVMEPTDSSLISAFFLIERHASKRLARLTAGLGRTHAGLEVFPLELFQMKLQLLVEFVVEPILADQRLHPLFADSNETREGHGVNECVMRASAGVRRQRKAV